RIQVVGNNVPLSINTAPAVSQITLEPSTLSPPPPILTARRRDKGLTLLGYAKIEPLALKAEAWAAIPGISEGFLDIIRKGYSPQFSSQTASLSLRDLYHGEKRFKPWASVWNLETANEERGGHSSPLSERVGVFTSAIS
ncbi:MAG: hypothetical protein ACRCW3_00995, partial [Metamycoplasmataceae bacterium]